MRPKLPPWLTIATLLGGVPLLIVITGAILATFFADPPLVRGKQAYKEKDYRKAHRYLELATQQQPSSYEAHLYLALTRLRRQEYQEVFASLDRCAELRPGDPLTEEYRAQCYVSIGERQLRDDEHEQAHASFAAAIEICTALIESDPYRLELHELMAQIGMTQFNTLIDGARSMLAERLGSLEIESIMAKFSECVHAPSREQSRVDLRAFMAEEYPTFSGAVTLDNILLLARTEFERAIYHYDQTLRIDPQFTRAAKLLAHLHLAAQDTVKAYERCDYLLSLEPQDGDGARLSLKERERDINQAYYYRFLTGRMEAATTPESVTDPSEVAVWQEGRLRAAASSGETYLDGPEEGTRRTEVLVGVAEIYLQIEDQEGFLAIAKRISKDIGTSSWGLLYDGIASQVSGKVRRAAESLDQAFLKIPRHARGRLAMARAQRALGNPQRAVQEYRAAVENDPDLHVARRELIEVYRELGPQWIHDALDEGRALLTRDHRTQSSRELFRILERDALNPANLTIETEDQARAALARTPGDLYARLRLSEILLEKGSSGPSLEQARILLEVDRSLYPAQLVAGYALLAEGNLKGARSAFKRSVDQVKHRVEGHLGLARTYIAERRFQPAKRELDGTIKNYAPDSWELHLELVRLYLLLEDAAKLDKALTRAEEFISALRSEIEDVSPDTTEGETEEEARQKREEAERKRAELGLLLARREAETFYYRGRLALLSRDPEAARSRFLAIDERAPGSPRARFGLALVAVAEDNPQEALQHFQESVRSAAGRDVEIEVEALRSLIVLGTRTRQFDVVRDSYQSLLADKRQVEASSALATAFLDQNRGFEAIRHLQLGLRQNPRNPDLRASLGEAYHRNGDLRRATRELRIAVKGDPSLRRVYELLSDIFIASGQYQEAIKTLQRELWLERETHDVYRKLADLYFRTGSLTQAEKHVEKALKTEPDNPDVLAMKAGILIAKEAVEPAEAVLLRAASVIRPDDRRRLVMISTLLLGIDRPRRVLDLLGDGSGTGELDPSTPAQVITLRATALLTLDQTPRARAMIESYLALHPPRAGESGLPLLLAACFLEEGDLDRAQDAALTGFVTEDERAEVRLFFEACRSRTEILGTLARSLALGLALRAEPSLRPAAAAHLERVARAFPRVALPSLLHSSVLVQAGRLDEARTVLQNQIRFTPGYLPLYFALAKVHLAKDEPSAALAVFEEAEAINPTSSELYRLKAMAALDELAQAEDRDGKRTARDVSRERLSLRVAERNLYQSLELDPDQPQVRLTLGSILVRLERFQEAFLELRKAIRLDPTDARAYAELREILPKLPAAAKAASELADEMIGRFPDRPEGYLVRARIAQQEGRTAEALAIYRHTLDLDPFSAAARSGLASLVLAEGRIDETVRYLEDAVMCDPGRWRDAKQLAQILDERAGPDDKEELSRALAAYELCHTFYPNDESVIKRLLLFYLERNQVERAQKLAQRAIRTFPGDPSILTVMGWASLLEGRLEEADRTLRRALESSPDDPEIHYRLGYVLEQRGIKDDAQKEYRQALELAGAVDFAGRKDCEVRLDELTNKKGRTRRRPGDRSPAGPDG